MISITGEKAIDDLLKALPQSVTHSILGSAHFAAAKPLVEKEKLLAPEGPTGNLVDSIGAYRLPIRKATELGEVRVGPRRRSPYKGRHGHLIEFGFKTRLKSGGKGKAFVSGKPFARPAFEATKGEIERNIAVNIAKSVLRTMRRYAK